MGVPGLAGANMVFPDVSIAAEGATDAARGAADIVLTESGLSTIVHAICQSGSSSAYAQLLDLHLYCHPP